VSVLHAPRKAEVDRRLFWFPAIILPLFAILLYRLWTIQVLNSNQLVEEAARSRKSSTKKLAPRGAILDRRGVLLASVKPEYVVTVKPSEFRKHPEIAAKLAQILNLPEEEVVDRIQKEAWRNIPADVKVGVSVETATKIAEATDLPGVAIDEKPMRHYTDTLNFTHVLGYVGTPTEKDVERLSEQNIMPAEYVGRDGIEKAYEADLMGTPGVDTVEKIGKAKFSSQEAAISGHQLFLTLDANVQTFAQEQFRKRGMRGAVVAIEPKTGEILCMISNPTFDSNVFSGGISKANYSALTNEENGSPMLNRAISSSFPPGSTYKIVTAIAAYKSGHLHSGTSVYCNGGFQLGPRAKPLGCMGTHGGIGFHQAMTRSCNTFFCTIGVRTGKKEMVHWAQECGLGQRTNIEILGETKGILPTDSWLEKRKQRFTKGNLANMSIGQGDTNTSPLQMANLLAMVANDGVQYRPHLVRAKKDPVTGEAQYVNPEIVHKIEAEQWFWDMLKDSLISVIESGTAQSAKINGISWGGKTGSAEQGRKGEGKTHSWFVGFAPRQNPKIAICVFAEAAGHGGDVAAPIAGAIVERYLRRPANDSSKLALSARKSN
jgi:penicillin-binding protein 2